MEREKKGGSMVRNGRDGRVSPRGRGGGDLLDRRSLLRAGGAGAIGLALSACSSVPVRKKAGAGGGKVVLPVPNPAQSAWQDAEVGLVFHYDLHVFDGKRYKQWVNRKTPIPNIQIFDPPELDTDQWVAAAKAAGAGFALLTACHETGFRLWQSDVNPYCMKALEWRNGKGDLVRDFVESCRKAGIEPGIYFGARWNSHLKVLNFRVRPGSPLTQEQYNHLIEKEVEEICSRYGDLFELWFDGGILSPAQGGPDVLPIVERLQPRCLFYHSPQRADARWGGCERGVVGYPCWARLPFKSPTGRRVKRSLLAHGDENGKYWCPAMADAPLRNHEWFWEPGDERKVYSLDALVNMYEKSVGRNATLILGVAPDPRGLVPGPDFKRLEEFGKVIRKRFAEPLAEGKGRGSVTVVNPAGPARVGQAVFMEEISRGERIRAYVLEGKTGGDEWTLLAEGSSVGHKRIEVFPPREVSAVRLRVTRSVAEPLIRKLAVYGPV